LDIVTETGELAGNFIEPGIAIDDHVFAHIATFAQESDTHGAQP
jgi:hypothetical protein